MYANIAMYMRLTIAKIFLAFISFVLAFIGGLPAAKAAGDASLPFTPYTGSYLVGSTFDVTVALDTHGQQINTVELRMTFPPYMLQVIKPVGGTSFIQSWFSPPAFSNKDGTLTLIGGIAPGGVNTSNGLVTTITFRAVAPGDAVLTILKSSKVLAHDGQGTDVLGSRGSAVFASDSRGAQR